MEQWRKDARQEPVITDLDALVPKDHLLRKIEKVMDYEWLYERPSQPQTRISEPTESSRRNARIAQAGENAEQTQKDRKFSTLISGRSTWIWWSSCKRRSGAKRSMRSARRPLNKSLRTQKKNTA